MENFNLKQIIDAVNEADAKLAKIKQDLIEFMRRNDGTLLSPPPVTPPVPRMTDAEAAQRMLMLSRTIGGRRIDPVVEAGYPGTLTCPLTGHVLSVPQAAAGEMFIGYCHRVIDQATGGKGNDYWGSVGGLFLGASYLFDRFGGFKEDGSNWHLGADRFFNMRAYMSPAELAADDAAKAGWAARWVGK